jgi:hypothetical protein
MIRLEIEVADDFFAVPDETTTAEEKPTVLGVVAHLAANARRLLEDNGVKVNRVRIEDEP